MKFNYKGFNAQGHERTGFIEATSKEDAAGKLRSEFGLFINTLEEDDQPIVMAPKEPPPSAPPAAATTPPQVSQPKQRTLDEDLEKGMEVIRLLKAAKLPKKLVERAKEEMILCLVRKAMLK